VLEHFRRGVSGLFFSEYDGAGHVYESWAEKQTNACLVEAIRAFTFSFCFELNSELTQIQLI